MWKSQRFSELDHQILVSLQEEEGFELAQDGKIIVKKDLALE